MNEHSGHNKPVRSQMDFHYIIKHCFDENTGALRTSPSDNTHFQINLNSAEDSISTVVQSLQVTGTDPVSCVGIKSVCLYSQSPASLQVSPADDGDEWYTAAEITVSGMSPVASICARRLRISGGKAVGQG